MAGGVHRTGLVALILTVGAGCGGSEAAGETTIQNATVPGVGTIRGFLPADRGPDARRPIPGKSLSAAEGRALLKETDRIFVSAPELKDRGSARAKHRMRAIVANSLYADQAAMGCLKPPLTATRVIDYVYTGAERQDRVAGVRGLRGYEQPQSCERQRLLIDQWETVHVVGNRAVVALRTRQQHLADEKWGGHRFKERLELRKVDRTWKIRLRASEDQDIRD